MISQKTLHEIDQNCREVKENYESPFGGICVVILPVCGDFYQMPPVLGHALY